jgi:drug/metabolite transporter (DMT)-like permease
MFLLLMPGARSNWSLRLLPLSLAYATTLVTYVAANKLTTSANATFLQSTAPLYLLLIGPLLLHEPVRRADFVVIGALAAGMSLFFLGPEEARATATNPPLGNVLGAISGVAWAATVAGVRWLARSGGESNASVAMVTLGNLSACLLCLPMALPLGQPKPSDWAGVGFLGVFQVGLAYVCLTRGIRRVPAFEGATLLLLEPALNPVWAWLMHGERPGPFAILGGVLILAATIFNAWWHSREM